EERDPGGVERAVVGGAGPVLPGRQIRAVVAGEEPDRRSGGDALDRRQEERVVVRPGDVELAGVVPSDHVHVDVDDDGVERDGRRLHERACALEPHLLGVEGCKDDGVSGSVLLEVPGERHERGGAGGVVVGAVVDGVSGLVGPSDPDVVVVGGEHDVALGVLGATDHADDVRAAVLGAVAPAGEGELVGESFPDGYEADLLERGDDVLASAGVPFAPRATAGEGVGGEEEEVVEHDFGVDARPFGRGIRSGLLARGPGRERQGDEREGEGQTSHGTDSPERVGNDRFRHVAYAGPESRVQAPEAAPLKARRVRSWTSRAVALGCTAGRAAARPAVRRITPWWARRSAAAPGTAAIPSARRCAVWSA